MQAYFIFSLFFVLYPDIAKAESLSGWIHNPPYKNGTLVDEIQCYAIPTGGIGFASHVLTYYTIAMLYYQRRPYWPFSKSRYGIRNIVLAIVSLILTIIVSALTMVRCRNRWQFVAIGAWKLGLSLTLGFITLHTALGFALRDDYVEDYYDEGAEGTGKRLLWLLVYLPGLIAGLAGLFSLVSETIGSNHDIQLITYAFGGVIVFCGLIFGGLRFCGESGDCDIFETLFLSLASLVMSLPFMAFLGVLYSDWVLAAIAGNLVGSPSSDNAALYWTYFFAKRLPLLFS